MNRLTKEQIEEINDNTDNWRSGIFIQPTGIPTKFKTHVLYSRVISGGITGGNCGGPDGHYSIEVDHSDKEHKDHNEFSILDSVLEVIAPNISFMHYKILQKLIDYNDYSESEYYGNYKNYSIKFLVLEDLYDKLEKLGY